jgi:hypothetical protein
MSPVEPEAVVLEVAAYTSVSVELREGKAFAYACGAIISVLGTLAEVLAVARVNTLLEATLAVGLTLALIGHLVVRVALLGRALKGNTLDIALVLRHVLAVGGGLRLGLASSGLVVGLGLLLGLLTGTVLQGTTLILGLAIILGVLGLGVGLVVLGLIILGLFFRLVLGVVLRLLHLGVLLDLLGVGITRTVSITVRRVGPEVPGAGNGNTGRADDPAGLKCQWRSN